MWACMEFKVLTAVRMFLDALWSCRWLPTFWNERVASIFMVKSFHAEDLHRPVILDGLNAGLQRKTENNADGRNSFPFTGRRIQMSSCRNTLKYCSEIL
jgi:hypothetical protein